MGKKSSAPPPPDPVATANAQAAANAETARIQAELNRVNQVTPWGSSTWTRTPAQVPEMTTQGTVAPQAPSSPMSSAAREALSPFIDLGAFSQAQGGRQKAAEAANKPRTPEDIWTQTVSLSPNQQKILDEQEALSLALSGLANDYTGRIRQATSTPFTLDGLPAAPQADDAARQRIEGALFDRLNPQLERDQAAMETKLINQGLRPGTEAWTRAMDDQNRRVNDARLGVVAQGGQEMANLFSMGTAARQNAISERLMERNQPINEVAALLGTGPGVQAPQFANVPQVGVAPTDVVGPTYSSYQGQLAAWQDQQNTNRALMGGLFSLGGAGLGGWAYGAAMGSDSRIKEDIKRVGTLDNGLPVYTFRYIGSPVTMMGVMAQDVEQVIPDAVIEADGIKYVDYAKVA